MVESRHGVPKREAGGLWRASGRELRHERGLPNSRGVTKYCKADRRWVCSRSSLHPEARDDGRVIRRALDAARLDVDVTAREARQQFAVHEDQVDAQAVVAAESSLTVIPPAERLLRLLEVPECVDELEVGD